MRTVRHRRGFFQRAGVLEIGGDPGSEGAVVTELGLDPGRRGAPANHRIRVGLRQHSAGQLSPRTPTRGYYTKMLENDIITFWVSTDA